MIKTEGNFLQSGNKKTTMDWGGVSRSALLLFDICPLRRKQA